MRINKKIKEDFDRMVCLDIHRKKRREYIEGVYLSFRRLKESYGCLTGLLTHLSNLCMRSILKRELKELIKEGATPAQSVSAIEGILVGEYTHHKSSPLSDWF